MCAWDQAADLLLPSPQIPPAPWAGCCLLAAALRSTAVVLPLVSSPWRKEMKTIKLSLLYFLASAVGHLPGKLEL